MLNNVKDFCAAPITQVQKHMYTHICTYIYTHEQFQNTLISVALPYYLLQVN